MDTLVSLSGGVGSWYAASRWIERRGSAGVRLIFADTLIEDPDLYRFLEDCETDLGLPVERIADGRNPWQVFRDVRMIGNTRADPCSRVLKRDLLKDWAKDNLGSEFNVVVGIDFTESHRLDRIQGGWVKSGGNVVAPLCWDKPQIKDDALSSLEAKGIAPPSLYAKGFPHNNCGGFCVKAGQAQFALLLKTDPDLYQWHSDQEQETRVFLGRKDVAILRDRRGGTTKPMTMEEFKGRVETGDYNGKDWGSSCSCFTPPLPGIGVDAS